MINYRHLTLAFIFTAFLLSAIYVANFIRPTDIAHLPTPAPQPTVIPTSVPTGPGGWSAFRNDRFEYQLQYPTASAYTVSDSTVSFTNLAPSFNITDFGQSTSPDPLYDSNCGTSLTDSTVVDRPVTVGSLSGRYLVQKEGVLNLFHYCLVSPKNHLIVIKITYDKPQLPSLITKVIDSFRFTADVPPVVILAPPVGSKVTSPLTVTGTAPRGWTFEGVLRIYVEDSRHQPLAGGPIYTKLAPESDTTVSFSTTLKFIPKSASGYVTIKNDNPSGLPQNDKSYSIPIKFITN
ncbi:Gmad2 immunoglobulin-like domain-containing protein [Patescibacteria group bacterium]|nr:Gmad2 immunoglobulin-like domain-containing protein [Patescibacteria group bacterium]